MQQKNLVVDNSVNVVGKIISKPVFSHELYGEGFYNFNIEVPRLSNAVDILPAVISERIIDRKLLAVGTYIGLGGQIRSYNSSTEEGKRKLVLNIFVQNIDILDELSNDDCNNITLKGYICKPPTYRTTPFGREIADILLAVNRTYNKSDYIPCIAWGRNANFAKTLETGSNIELTGRFQSREYQKQYDNGDLVNKIAYEVSISTIKLSNNEENN